MRIVRFDHVTKEKALDYLLEQGMSLSMDTSIKEDTSGVTFETPSDRYEYSYYFRNAQTGSIEKSLFDLSFSGTNRTL